MAESTKDVAAGRPKPKPAAGTPATGKKETTRATPAREIVTSTPATAAGSRFRFFRGLVGRKASADTPASTPATTTASGGRPQRPANPSMGRFFLGMTLYMVLALAAQFLLEFIFVHVPGHGQAVVFTLPLLGAVNQFTLVWMLTLILILYGLYKFKVLPRTLGQPRERTAAAKANPAKDVKAAPAKATREPISGPNDEVYARVKARIRAERRKARRN
jgi:hypothetical protein